MKLVRKNVFETNSSSTHALVVAHNVNDKEYNLYDSLHHDYSFGREGYRLVDSYDEKLAYVYYVIKSLEDRSKTYKKDPSDTSYGLDYNITSEMIEEFKNKIGEAYNRVLQMIDYKPYDNDPTPEDIFNLIDLEWEDLGRSDWNYSSKKIDFVFEYKDDNPKILYVENGKLIENSRGELFVKYKNEDNENAVKEAVEGEILYRDPTDEEKLKIRLFEVLPSYMESSKICNTNDVYVDHTEEYKNNGFIEKIVKGSVEYLMKLIFNRNCYITIGGDEYQGYNIKTIGFEYDYDEEKYYVNEKGERCPRAEDFPDTEEGWEEYLEVSRDYNIETDDNGFWHKLKEYEKDHDVFLKGN